MKLKFIGGKTHAYWLDGKRCKGASGLGKTVDDTHNLERWGQRQVARGIAMRPTLVEDIAAHIDDRQRLDAIVDEARQAAGANDAAQRGTILHKILERVDLGLTIIDTPMSAVVRDAWRIALDLAGLDVLPDWIERVVVHPDLLIAGTLDRLVRRRSDGAVCVLDVKGGARALSYPNSISVQLAAYARAPYAASGTPVRDGDGVVWDEFIPLPENMDLELGYIAHIPEDNGEIAIHAIDITSGWDALQSLVLPVRAWQRQKVCTQIVADIPLKNAPFAETTVDATEVRDVSQPGETGAVPVPPGAIDVTPILPLPDVTLEVDAPEEGKPPGPTTIAGLPMETPWPPSPSPATGTEPGSSPGPTVPPPAPTASSSPLPSAVSPTPSNSPPPTEGAEMTVEDRDTIQRRYMALTPARQSLIQRWLTESVDHLGYGFGLRDIITERRIHILGSAVTAVALSLSEDVLRTLIGRAMGCDEPVPETVPLGAALGNLDHIEAARFGQTVRAIAAGDIPLSKANRLTAASTRAINMMMSSS